MSSLYTAALFAETICIDLQNYVIVCILVDSYWNASDLVVVLKTLEKQHYIVNYINYSCVKFFVIFHWQCVPRDWQGRLWQGHHGD